MTAPPQADDHAKPLVLIVDDEPANVQILVEALRADYRLKVATDGQTALDLAHRPDQPDLIILDVMMPGMDGFEVCRQLKGHEDTHEIPVIFVTLLHNSSAEFEGLQLNAVDFISKPINPTTLRLRVRNLVRLKLLQDQLRAMGELDGLTGIANRRRFDQCLDREWRRGQRDGQPLALLMLDVDLFKQYNDTYGHLAGDQCLQQVATTLASQIRRPGDLVARYGGEEFACVFAATDLPGAQGIAEALRAQVEHLRLPHAHSPHGVVTLSAGLVVAVPDASSHPHDLIERADQRLYQAKHAGRNRVVSA